MENKSSNNVTVLLRAAEVRKLRKVGIKAGRVKYLGLSNKRKSGKFKIPSDYVIVFQNDSPSIQFPSVVVTEHKLKEINTRVSKNLKYIYESEIKDIERFAAIAARLKK